MSDSPFDGLDSFAAAPESSEQSAEEFDWADDSFDAAATVWPGSAGSAQRTRKSRKAEQPAPGDQARSRKRRQRAHAKTEQLKELAPLIAVGLFVLGVLGYLGLSLWDPFAPRTPVVKQYNTFVGVQHGFRIDYPRDWSQTSGDDTGSLLTLAEFAGNGAEVKVKASYAGSMLGVVTQVGVDIANAMGPEAGIQQIAQLDPVQVVHEFRRRSFENEYSGFEEGPSTAIESDAWGPGRRSEWTGRQGWTTYQGLRATFLDGERQISLVFRIRATRYPAYQDVFEHMLNSFTQ